MKAKRLLLLAFVSFALAVGGAELSLISASDRTPSVRPETLNSTFPQTASPTRLAFFHVPPTIHNVVATPTVIAGGNVTVTVNLREPATRNGKVLLSRKIGSSFRLWKEKSFSKGSSRVTFRSLSVGCGTPGSNIWRSGIKQYQFSVSARLKYWEGNGSTVTTVTKHGNPVNVLKYVPWVRFVSQIYPAGRNNYFRSGENARHYVDLKQKSCGNSRVQIGYRIREWDREISDYRYYRPDTGGFTVPNPVTVKSGATRAVFAVTIPSKRPPYQYRLRAREFGTNRQWITGAWVGVLR